MHFGVLILGVTVGWSLLLFVPWSLTGEVNPFKIPASYAMLCPLILPFWFMLESEGCGCPTFTHQRLAWYASATNSPRPKLLLLGFTAGLAFSIPSAMIFNLVIAYGPSPSDASVALALLLLAVAAIHLTFFIVSIFAAVELAKYRARRVFAAAESKVPSNQTHSE